MERYIEITGFSNYEVSNYGKIKNIKTGRILKDSSTHNGYRKISLSKDGVVGYYRVHRLVCEHFNANPGHKPHVDHKDEDKSNNRADNLRWCTNRENLDFYYENNPEKKGVPRDKVYGNRADMIKAIGKPVCVNGIEFVSAGGAAKYICEKEPGKKQATVSKEIRRMISGKRSFETMYGKYEINDILV